MSKVEIVKTLISASASGPSSVCSTPVSAKSSGPVTSKATNGPCLRRLGFGTDEAWQTIEVSVAVAVTENSVDADAHEGTWRRGRGGRRRARPGAG